MLSASSVVMEGEVPGLTHPQWSRLLLSAAEEPECRLSLLEYLRRALGYDQAALVEARQGFRKPAVLCFSGARSGLSHWFDRDPIWRSLAGRETNVGEAFLTHELVADEALELNAFYREQLAPRNWHFGFLLPVMVEGERVIVLTMLRARAAGPCRREELEPLLPHLPSVAAALRAGERLDEMRHGQSALQRAANRLPHGYLLMNRDLRILFSNDQAKRILDGRFFLRIHDDHLAAAESALERQVSTVLSRVLNPERSEEGRPGMRIRTPGGAADLWIYPEKLDLPHAPRRRGGAEIAVTLIASDEEALLRPDLLAALFRLTPAEARVASLAGLGMPLSEVAERCGTKILTVKSQLSQVYKKLGVNRQGELAILMVRAAGL